MAIFCGFRRLNLIMMVMIMMIMMIMMMMMIMIMIMIMIMMIMIMIKSQRNCDEIATERASKSGGAALDGSTAFSTTGLSGLRSGRGGKVLGQQRMIIGQTQNRGAGSGE